MPFYIKGDGNWVRLTGPTDIRDDDRQCLASVYPNQKDPDQLTLCLPEDVTVIAISERRDVVFPGQEDLINRDDIVIYNLHTGEMIAAVIHSNEPIEGYDKEGKQFPRRKGEKMKARELAENAWFKWLSGWRVWQRLPGPVETVEGQECVPVRPLQPTANEPGYYIPADDKVELFKEKSIRLA